MFTSLKTISEKVYFSDNFLTRNKELKYVGGDSNYIPEQGSLTVFRYMRISNLGEMMNGKMRFESPFRWTDPFEYLFYESDIKIGNKTYSVACCCFTLDSSSNEESLWKVHSNNSQNANDTIIRVAMKLDVLCKTLAKSNPDYTFYVSDVDYSMSREQILNLHTKRQGKYKSIDEYITDLTIKRRAFKFENELRIFAVKEGIIQFKDFFCMINIKFTKSLITSVTLPPLDPKNNKNNYSKQQEQESNKLKHLLKVKIKYKNKIYQSRLYDIEKKNIMEKSNKRKQ